MSETEKIEPKEYIVGLSKDFCHVEPVITASMLNDPLGVRAGYQATLNKYDLKWGDIVPHNNILWGTVFARNTLEALNIFGQKIRLCGDIIRIKQMTEKLKGGTMAIAKLFGYESYEEWKKHILDELKGDSE